MTRTQSRPLRICYGVCGGIAAYKGAYLLRQFTEAGHDVTVMATESALQMVGAPTWQALSGKPVATDIFAGSTHVDHIRLASEADLVVIAPATANTIAKLACGMADNILTATVLATTAPVVIAPAMHTGMWENPATQQNVATLRARGMHVMTPASGRLTGTDSGIGRLPEPQAIAAYALASVAPIPRDLEGKTVLVTAGGTREALDPVRYLANRSSGRQGVAIAAAAARRGAKVELLAANIAADVLALLPPEVQVDEVSSARELSAACQQAAASADVIVMAAAVADYRPAATSESKRKKTGDSLTLELVENPDILRELVRAKRPGQIIIGFAAETGDEQKTAVQYGIEKARRKGADMLAINTVGANTGFGDTDNYVHLVTADGALLGEGGGAKSDVATVILDTLSRLIDQSI